MELRRIISRFAWNHPIFYRLIGRIQNRGDVWSLDYDLVFDGFPRSGNTFGSKMLSVSQGDRFAFRAHKHIPPFIIWALQNHKPACLPLRNPADAIISWTIYSNQTLESVLKYYIDFHEIMLPHRTQLLVLPFPIITEDFPTMLKLMNMRFGLHLQIPLNLESCKKQAFARIDDRWRDKDGLVDNLRVGRPHPMRKEQQVALREELKSPRYRVLLQECEHLYQIFEKEFQHDFAKLQESEMALK